MGKSYIHKKAQLCCRIKLYVKDEFDDFCKKNGLKQGLVLERLIVLLMKKNNDTK